MKEKITESRFIDIFNARRPNQFTYEGLSALFEHLVQLEEEMGIEMEFDVIGLCCDYCEYDSLKEFQKVGELITKIIKGLSNNPSDNSKIEADVRNEVIELCASFPIYNKLKQQL